MTGTIVGLDAEIFMGSSVAGYHLHFISDDQTFGGHVMDFVIGRNHEVGAVDPVGSTFPCPGSSVPLC